MTTRIAAALLASILAGFAQTQTHAADAHHDHHAPPASPAARPAGDATTRFATDEALRTGMAGIRGAVAVLAHHEAGHLGAQQVLEQAGAIEKQIDYLVANCKLEPQADATLHGIITRLLAATRALHAAPTDPAPVAGLRAALDEYNERFDDHARAE